MDNGAIERISIFSRHSDQAGIVNADDDEEIRDGVKPCYSCRIAVPYMADDEAVSHLSSGPQREGLASLKKINKKTRSQSIGAV